MSYFTTELRYICEEYAGLKASEGYNSINDVISKAIPKVFDFDFPLFDPDYRNVLCAKILKHYYTREIGEKTVGLWKLRLDSRLNEIMPYYNELYNSARIKFDPLSTHNLTTEYTLKKDETSNEESNSQGKRNSNSTNEISQNTDTKTNSKTDINKNETNKDLYSDTPQGALTGVENETYLTNARKTIKNGDENNINESSGVSNSTGNTVNNQDETFNEDNKVTNNVISTDNYLQKISGYSNIDTSSLIKAFRDTIINIDSMIIDELNDLFLGVWGYHYV